MEMDTYQTHAQATAKYPDYVGLTYCVLGLASEAGEVAGKLKKAMRDEGYVPPVVGGLHESRKNDMVAELGDVLWYVAMTAKELGFSLSEVAERNIAKLADRQTRDVIGGDGDKR